tara:strand:+ start:682 stop:1002 length:321 start_codon:yes stop_codon:yes gene_type:complete
MDETKNIFIRFWRFSGSPAFDFGFLSALGLFLSGLAVTFTILNYFNMESDGKYIFFSFYIISFLIFYFSLDKKFRETNLLVKTFIYISIVLFLITLGAVIYFGNLF